MTSGASLLGILQALAVQLAAFMAALLLASGLHKLTRRRRIQAAINELVGLSRRLAPLVAGAVAAAELLAGGLLLTSSHRAIGAALAVTIWGAYLLLILRAIVQGRLDIDCGCTFGAARHPLRSYHVARNAVLTGIALLVAVVPAPGTSVPLAAAQILAALGLLALYGALDQVMALQPLRSGEVL